MFRPGIERRNDVLAIPNAKTSEVCPAVLNERSEFRNCQDDPL